MPKSKCNRLVTLSKTKKKPGLERKGKVVAKIKDAIDKYSSAYVFTYNNMRNQKLKDLREQLKSSSRIFLAGKKVMQIVLGRSPANGAKTSLHKLSKGNFVEIGKDVNGIKIFPVSSKEILPDGSLSDLNSGQQNTASL